MQHIRTYVRTYVRAPFHCVGLAGCPLMICSHSSSSNRHGSCASTPHSNPYPKKVPVSPQHTECYDAQLGVRAPLPARVASVVAIDPDIVGNNPQPNNVLARRHPANVYHKIPGALAATQCCTVAVPLIDKVPNPIAPDAYDALHPALDFQEETVSQSAHRHMSTGRTFAGAVIDVAVRQNRWRIYLHCCLTRINAALCHPSNVCIWCLTFSGWVP